jgi:hypothetical protein
MSVSTMSVTAMTLTTMTLSKSMHMAKSITMIAETTTFHEFI